MTSSAGGALSSSREPGGLSWLTGCVVRNNTATHVRTKNSERFGLTPWHIRFVSLARMMMMDHSLSNNILGLKSSKQYYRLEAPFIPMTAITTSQLTKPCSKRIGLLMCAVVQCGSRQVISSVPIWSLGRIAPFGTIGVPSGRIVVAPRIHSMWTIRVSIATTPAYLGMEP